MAILNRASITVSIFILTYNQEEFISQTLESILAQKTNFKYQLVIGEDVVQMQFKKQNEKLVRGIILF